MNDLNVSPAQIEAIAKEFLFNPIDSKTIHAEAKKLLDASPALRRLFAAACAEPSSTIPGIFGATIHLGILIGRADAQAAAKN